MRRRRSSPPIRRAASRCSTRWGRRCPASGSPGARCGSSARRTRGGPGASRARSTTGPSSAPTTSTRLTAAPRRLAARHLARRAPGQVRRLDEPLHRRRAHLGNEPSDLQRSDLSLLPDLGRGGGQRRDLRRLARDPARRRPRRRGHPLDGRRRHLGRPGAGPGRRLGLSRVSACRAFARGGFERRGPRGLVDREAGRSRRLLRPLHRRREDLHGPADRDRRDGAPGPRPARGRGRPGLRRLGRRPGRHPPGPAAPVHRRRRQPSSAKSS